jgi:Flp pilus assembly protein TadD
VRQQNAVDDVHDAVGGEDIRGGHGGGSVDVHARAARVDAQEVALHRGDAAALTQKRLGRVVVAETW